MEMSGGREEDYDDIPLTCVKNDRDRLQRADASGGDAREMVVLAVRWCAMGMIKEKREHGRALSRGRRLAGAGTYSLPNLDETRSIIPEKHRVFRWSLSTCTLAGLRERSAVNAEYQDTTCLKDDPTLKSPTSTVPLPIQSST